MYMLSLQAEGQSHLCNYLDGRNIFLVFLQLDPLTLLYLEVLMIYVFDA